MHASEDIISAATAGDANRVREILSADSDLVNAYGDDGWTPLHVAAFFGHVQAAELLLESGADIHARSHNLMDNMPLHAAVIGHSRDLVQYLLDCGADINARQDGGWTPLHEAALRGNAEMVWLLVQRGAAVNLRKDDGTTPLGLALEKGHAQVSELLRLHGGKE